MKAIGPLGVELAAEDEKEVRLGANRGEVAAGESGGSEDEAEAAV
mgnify:CR=1 FL=1